MLRVELPDENHGQVLAYVHWLHTGKLPSVDSSVLSYGHRPTSEGHHEYTVLSRTFAFGQKIDDGNYQDAAITAILQVFAESSSSAEQPTQPSVEHGEWAYHNTGQHSHLTRLFLDIYGYCTQRKLASEETPGWLLETIKIGLPRSIKEASNGEIQLLDADTVPQALRACDHHCAHGRLQGHALGWQCPYEWEWPQTVTQDVRQGAHTGQSDGTDEVHPLESPSILEGSQSRKEHPRNGDGASHVSKTSPDEGSSWRSAVERTNAGEGPAAKEATGLYVIGVDKAQDDGKQVQTATSQLQASPQNAERGEQDGWRCVRPKEDTWAWIDAHSREPSSLISCHPAANAKTGAKGDFTEYLYKTTPHLYRPVDPDTVSDSDGDANHSMTSRDTMIERSAITHEHRSQSRGPHVKPDQPPEVPATRDGKQVSTSAPITTFSSKGKQRAGEPACPSANAEHTNGERPSDWFVHTSATASSATNNGLRICPELPGPEIYRDKGTHRLSAHQEMNDQTYWRNVQDRTAAAAKFDTSRSPSPRQACTHDLEQLNSADPVVEREVVSESRTEKQNGSLTSPLNGQAAAASITNSPTTASQPQSGRGHWTYRVASPPDRQLEYVEPHSFWTTSTNAPSHPLPPDQEAAQSVQARRITRAYWGEPWIMCPNIRKEVYADDA